jgi:hypothetical protein
VYCYAQYSTKRGMKHLTPLMVWKRRIAEFLNEPNSSREVGLH